MPQLWQLARIVAIYKTEGATTLPQNYRPIALLQAMYKVFTPLIERRLRVLEPQLWKMQMGYRSGRSTDDANHLLLRAIELTLRWQNIPLYLLCLDWKKCYDRIHIKRLLQALRRFGLPDHFLQTLEVIYSNMQCFDSPDHARSKLERTSCGDSLMRNAARDRSSAGCKRLRQNAESLPRCVEFAENSAKNEICIGQMKSKHFRHPLPAQARPKFTITNLLGFEIRS